MHDKVGMTVYFLLELFRLVSIHHILLLALDRYHQNLLLFHLKNIKNFIPYLLLVAIYFLFINIEARKNQNINDLNETENTNTLDKIETIDSALAKQNSS